MDGKLVTVSSIYLNEWKFLIDSELTCIHVRNTLYIPVDKRQ